VKWEYNQINVTLCNHDANRVSAKYAIAYRCVHIEC